MKPFINIHTHHLCKSNELCIRNVLPENWNDTLFEPGSFYSVGLHPWYLSSEENANLQLDIMKNRISESGFIAIGEAGLDKICQTSWDLQVSTFKKQVVLAERCTKPMIIHCVKSFNEILAIRKEMKAMQPWIFHGFSSSVEMAHQILDVGCFLSFGKMTFKARSKASNVLKALKSEQFFLETDDDDVSIEDVYQKAAELRNTTLEELKDQQIQNFENLFTEVSFPFNTL